MLTGTAQSSTRQSSTRQSSTGQSSTPTSTPAGYARWAAAHPDAARDAERWLAEVLGEHIALPRREPGTRHEGATGS